MIIIILQLPTLDIAPHPPNIPNKAHTHQSRRTFSGRAVYSRRRCFQTATNHPVPILGRNTTPPPRTPFTNLHHLLLLVQATPQRCSTQILDRWETHQWRWEMSHHHYPPFPALHLPSPDNGIDRDDLSLGRKRERKKNPRQTLKSQSWGRVIGTAHIKKSKGG